MRDILKILMVFFVVAFALSSCTRQEIVPEGEWDFDRVLSDHRDLPTDELDGEEAIDTSLPDEGPTGDSGDEITDDEDDEDEDDGDAARNVAN